MKIFKKILNYLIIILACAFCGFSIGLTLINDLAKNQILLGAILALVGAIVVNYSHIILHELGHLIGGKLGGYTLYSFRVGFVKITRVNGKLALRFQKLGNNYGGVCQMFPSGNVDLEKKFHKFIAGGIGTSALITAVLGVVVTLRYFIDVNPFVYLFFATAFPFVFITFVMNLSTTAKVVGMTDGMFLKALREKSPDGICAIKTLNLQSMFIGGVRPRDIPLEIVEDFPVLPDDNVNRLVMFSNQLACYYDRKCESKILEIANRFEENLEFLPSIYHAQILGEVFYVEAKYKHNLEKAREIYEKIIPELGKEKDISVLRIMVAYQVIICKDIETARKIATLTDQLFELSPMKGVAIMERDIINELVQ
ncbi:MAG: hypothetical protein RR458_00335 [Clostridia bacterium]